MIFGRGRFDELVGRQLDLFEHDEADLLEEAARAERAWQESGREEAEERYGDYQLVVDAAADRLLDIRESYSRTLGDEAVAPYADAFYRAARKRFPRFTSLLADLEP